MAYSIIIIGNGFDLKCKLNSRFSDFITFQNMEVWISNPIACPNFWYLLFALKYRKYPDDFFRNRLFSGSNKSELLWMDIEGFIKDVFTKKVPTHYQRIATTNKYPELFALVYDNRFNPMYLKDDSDITTIKKFFAHYNFDRFDNKPIDIYEYLKTEFYEFEKDFSKYLKETIEQTPSYLSDAKELFRSIGTVYSNTYLIDFNYTHDDEKFSEFLPQKVNFIHGSISQGIIIGFDSSNVSDESPIFLSKSWRKMTSNLTAPPLFEFNEPLYIKFFGHSLGPQDYSYFHALFDKYDIYNNNVRLIFLYERYGKTEEENEQIAKKYYDSIYSLLNNYALSVFDRIVL